MKRKPGGLRAAVAGMGCLLAACATAPRDVASRSPGVAEDASARAGRAVAVGVEERKPVAVRQNVTTEVAVVARGVVKEIDLTTFFGLREAGQAVVYDVRPGLFYRMGHIPGAVAFSGKAFGERFPQEKPAMDAAVKAGRTIVLYCTNVDCPDGGVVAGWLADRGYPVSVYKGGWEEWKGAGLPTE